MMQQMWKSFPRHFEQKVNGLLDQAEPTEAKAFQLYKVCQQQKLWSSSFEEFSTEVKIFFSKARRDRCKGEVDRFLDRPLDQLDYEDYHLTFRNAAINPNDVREIASWAHNMLRVGGRLDSVASSIQTLNEVLLAVTQPSYLEKDSDIEFSDICERWQKIISTKLGSQITTDVKILFEKLDHLDQQSKHYRNNKSVAVVTSTEMTINSHDFNPSEMNWILQVKNRATNFGKMPKFPVSNGSAKIQLIQLERIVTLYTIIQLTDREELMKHRESIRTTVLDRCRLLLQ